MKAKSSLPPALFLGGALALDFLNSVAIPADAVVEWLGNGVDLLSWMRQAGLLTDDDVRMIGRRVSAGNLDAMAKDARALREWFRGFVRENQGSPLKKQARNQLGSLNRLLGSDTVSWQIEPAESTPNDREGKRPSTAVFHLRARRNWSKPGALLSLLAEEIAKFICATDFRHVKACAGAKCTLFFLDQSHRQGRKWCSMAICGNRAKSAAFAARSRSVNGKRAPSSKRK